MSEIIVPVIIFLIAGLGVLGLLLLERRPAREWGHTLSSLREDEATTSQPLQVVTQDVSLSDMFISDSTPVYTGTARIQGLVNAVEKTFDVAEQSVQVVRTKTRTHA